MHSCPPPLPDGLWLTGMKPSMLPTSIWAIWDFALQTAAVIVTKDEDFAQRHVLTGGGPRVVWIRLPNTRQRELLLWFEAILPDVLAALERGETLIEVI